MDPTRFDDLTRILSAASGRRPVLGALLGAALGGALADASARKRGKARGSDERARETDGRLQAERRRKGGTRRKKKGKKKRGGNGGGSPQPRADCCGARSCAAPERGSTRAQCNFAGRSFVGEDHNGSIFRGIDGRDAAFSATDNRGSVFADACLQGARFRRARLGGSTWGGACLFGADFTGADLGGDDTLFANALFCDTVRPDGSVNDRDCGRATACCRAPDEEPGPGCRPDGAACAQNGDCCGGNCFDGLCAGRPADCGNTTCPGNAVGCCLDTCCLAPTNQCNPGGLCCAPNCAGKACGDDGCGGGNTCGDCADGQTCNANGRCVCTPQSCPDGCCDGVTCRPGTANQACGDGGRPCATCGAGQICQAQSCAACQPQCTGKTCGPDGCGGSCGACPDGQRCDNGQCYCDAQSCPNGCCVNGPGNPGLCRPGTTSQNCGSGGAACRQCTALEQCEEGACVPATCAGTCTQDNDCPDFRNCVCNRVEGTCCARNCVNKVCGSDGCSGTCENLCPPNTVCNDDGTACLCTAQSCPNGCCSNGLGNPGTCVAGNTNQACGRPGESCQECTGREQCQSNQCVCIPLTCDDLTSECGTFSDGCGGTLECGTCPDPENPSCFVGVCAPCTVACKNGEDCYNLTNGNTICQTGADIDCGEPCSTNANCTDDQYPICVASLTNGARSNPPNQTTPIATFCEGEPAACAAMNN